MARLLSIVEWPREADDACDGVDGKRLLLLVQKAVVDLPVDSFVGILGSNNTNALKNNWKA